MTVGEQIKILRKQLGLSQEEFAFAISIKQGSLSQIESGTTSISQRTLKIICGEYSVNPKWLMKGEGEMFISDINLKENFAPVKSEVEFWKELAMAQIKILDTLTQSNKAVADANAKSIDVVEIVCKKILNLLQTDVNSKEKVIDQTV